MPRITSVMVDHCYERYFWLLFSWSYRVFLVPQDRVLDKAAYECPKKSAGDDGNVCILPTERDKWRMYIANELRKSEK